MQWPAARIVTGIALAAALAFPGAPAMADAAPSAALSRGQATALDAIGNAALAKQHVPGFVLMIVSDGDIVYGKGFGYSDVAAELYGRHRLLSHDRTLGRRHAARHHGLGRVKAARFSARHALCIQ